MKAKLSVLFFLPFLAMCFSTVAQISYNLESIEVARSAYTLNLNDTFIYSFRISNSSSNGGNISCFPSGLDYNYPLKVSGSIYCPMGGAVYDIDTVLINPYRTSPLFIPADSLSGVIDFKIPLSSPLLSGYSFLVIYFLHDSAVHPTCRDSLTNQSFSVQNPNCRPYFQIYPTSTSGLYTGVNMSTGTNLTYHWEFGDGDTSNLAYPTHTYAAPGMYHLTLTVSNGACADQYTTSYNLVFKNDDNQMIQLVITPPTGIVEIENAQTINPYPNPATNQLTINLNGLQAEQVSIYNVDGKLVSETKQPAGNRIDVSSLAKGVYIAEVKLREAMQRVRWVKM